MSIRLTFISVLGLELTKKNVDVYDFYNKLYEEEIKFEGFNFALNDEDSKASIVFYLNKDIKKLYDDGGYTVVKSQTISLDEVEEFKTKLEGLKNQLAPHVKNLNGVTPKFLTLMEVH